MLISILTCASLYVIDGDTIRCDKESVRLLGPGRPYEGGFNAPETRGPKCERERVLAYEAKARMLELVKTPGARIESSGVRDRYGRLLGWVRLPSGESAGAVLVREGLAQKWPGGEGWCE